MASIFFDQNHGTWRCKWRSYRGRKYAADPKARKSTWKTERLCTHPGWTPGARAPKRPPFHALNLFRHFQDLERQATLGVAVATREGTSLAGFLQAYLERREAGSAKGTMRCVRRIVAGFQSWCEARVEPVTTLEGVTVEVCRDYMAARAKSAKWATLKTERGTLSPAWSAAIEEGRIQENPWRRAKVPGKDVKEPPPFWTREEVDRLIAASPAWLKDVITVGVNSGLRITALLKLRWSDVDFAKGTIHVRGVNSKGGRAYDAPMMDAARDVFQRLEMRDKKAGGSGRVFSRPRSGKELDQGDTFVAIGTAVKKSKIRNQGRFNHILRHTFATWAVNRGVPLKVVSTWLGHSTIQMTEKYAHADPRETKRWAEFFSSHQASP